MIVCHLQRISSGSDPTPGILLDEMDKFMVDLDSVLDELEAEEVNNVYLNSSLESPLVKSAPLDESSLRVNPEAKIDDNCVQSEAIDLDESQAKEERLLISLCTPEEKTPVEQVIETPRLEESVDLQSVAADAIEIGGARTDFDGKQTTPDDGGTIEDKPVSQSSNNAEKLLSFDDCVVEDLTESELNEYFADLKEAVISEAEDASSFATSSQQHVDVSSTDHHDVTPSSEPVYSESSPSALASNNLVESEQLARPSSLMLPSTYNSCDERTLDKTQMEMLVEEDGESQRHDGIDNDFIVGRYKPFWIPDAEAPACMTCDAKFNVIKRRHHCRACGKVLCSQCCNAKAKLPYLENKEARVCRICLPLLSGESEESEETAQSSASAGFPPDASPQGSASFPNSPNPNNPSEYCSSIPPLEQAEGALHRPPPTVFVPVGVLRKGDKPRGEPKQVVFSDGIRPGSDLSEPDTPQAIPVQHRQLKRLKSPSIEKNSSLAGSLKLSKIEKKRAKNNRVTIIDTNGPLPAVINCTAVLEDPTAEKLVEVLADENYAPVLFYLTKNLHVSAKIVKLDCCVQTTCWVFASRGLASVGQDEIIVAIEKLSNENLVPRDAFRLLTSVYDSASRGSPFGELSHIIFTEGLFENKDNGGFMFIRPTFQCLSKFILPSPPFLVAILLHKWEIPWAKILPLRLLLRLGSEYSYYPSPLVSYRDRKPTYCEIGHTIMNVLADFRNFQYTLPFIPGLVVHMEDKNATVSFPRNRYENVMKALGSSNEHVLAFGATFSMEADSHLCCIQNDDGQYQTRVEYDRSRLQESGTVTGATFIVFSGALKSSTGLSAKMSIVEDGLLVQIPPTTMEELRNSLKNMHDYTVKCGKIESADTNDFIKLIWTKEDKNFNMGVRSMIDDLSLEGVYSVRIYNGTDYAGDKYFIRWTEVFFIQNEDISKRGDSVDPTKLAGVIAQSLCLALTPHLDHLVDNNFIKIALRVTLDPEKVGYDVGSNGQSLPNAYVNELDGALIPVIMGNLAANVESLLVIELVFHILIK